MDWLSKSQRSRNMAAIRSAGTAPERRLAGLIRKVFPRHRVVERPFLPGRPDYYLPGLHLAVFADGCFWHNCPKHGHIPQDNRRYWRPKLLRNAAKDRVANKMLRREGIVVVRIWEHDLKRGMGRASARLRRLRMRIDAASSFQSPIRVSALRRPR
jgi:DNA mismatch endonuclease (patch repair protein)